MTDIQQDRDEYQNIQRWLAGEHPPAAGRTWRRTIHDTLTEALPTPVMSKIDRAVAMIPGVRGAPWVLRGGATIFIASTTPMLLQMLTPLEVGTASVLGTALLPLVTAITAFVSGLGAIQALVGLCFFLVNGA